MDRLKESFRVLGRFCHIVVDLFPSWCEKTLPIRIIVGHFVLLMVVFFPLLATISYGSLLVNYWTALIQLLFVAVMLPESLRLIRQSWHEFYVFKIFVLVFFVIVGSWTIRYIPLLGIYRGWVYVAQFFFFFAVLAFLCRSERNGFWFFFYLKFAALIFVSIYFLWSYFHIDTNHWRETVKPNPPIYRHLRHLNYDLAFLLGLTLWAFLQQKKNVFLYVIVFMLVGFLSVWSAGRGQWLAGVGFLFLLLLNSKIRADWRRLLVAFSGLFLGAFLVFLSGETHLIYDSISRSLDGETVNSISSGRLGIWARSFDSIHGFQQWAFGFGPDAFIRLGVVGGNIVQPHSFIVQLLLEFGIIGASCVFYLLFKLLLNCARNILSMTGHSYLVVPSALIISIVGFALVDGLFYHVIPLSSFLVFVAYLMKAWGVRVLGGPSLNHRSFESS